MAKLHADLVSALPTGEKPPPGGFFEVVLCRDHCVLAKEVGARRKGGKPWDTVKPLARYFEDLTQVVLVDDSPHKSLPEEAGNMLVMPVWAGPDTESGLTDAALPALVNGLLEAFKAVQATLQDKNVSPLTEDAPAANRIQDIRPIIEEISKTLMILHPPAPSTTADDDESKEKEEDSGLAIVNGVSRKCNRTSTRPPPGLPPPPHFFQGAVGASIGAEAIHHHPALYFLVLVTLKEAPSIPGASLFDINTLLQTKFMAAYSTLFKKSAKATVKALVDLGTLSTLPENASLINSNSTSTSTSTTTTGYIGDRGTRYSLKKDGVKLPSGDRFLEIERYAQNLAPLNLRNCREKEEQTISTEAVAEVPVGATPAVETTANTTNNNTPPEVVANVEQMMMNDLVVSIMVELETRPGISKDSLDTVLSSIFTQIPALQGWFGPHVGRDVTRKVMECLRRVMQDALDAWVSSGDVEMVGLRDGNTPPSLFHVQITPDKGLQTVQNAVFDMAKLMEDAALDMAIVLQQWGVTFVPVGTAKTKVVQKKKKEKTGDVLQVFEDRGTLTACAVPVGTDVALEQQQQQQLQTDAAAAGEEKITKAKEIEISVPLHKKRKNETSPPTATTTTSLPPKTKTTTSTATPGGIEMVLTRGQQKLAAMRAKLGLPQDCGLTKAELKELVKEANREKQKKRDEEIQAAKAAKHRGAALMAPLQATLLSNTTIENAGTPSGARLPYAGADDSNRNLLDDATEIKQQLTPLHVEIAELARQATPTPSEIATVQGVVHAVDSAARDVWPAARAVLFGSQATGLALPGGDLDIVVLGVGPQLQRAATGFTTGQRRVLGEHLEDLLDALRCNGTLLSSVEIIDAKIPIIKCLIQTSHAEPALPADISFGAINGAAAVTFLRRQILAVPPLRPLSLVVKAFLRDRGLNEVFTGGIGSYAVVNMVLAHLQREGFQADITQADKLGLSRSSLLNRKNNGTAHKKKVMIVDGKILVQGGEQQQQQEEKQMDLKHLQDEEKQQQPGVGTEEYDDTETFTYLEQLAAASNGATAASASSFSSFSDNNDYGMLLWGFLERFSHEFDFLRQAISIRQGGFVKKGKWKQARKPWLLAVEDPQEPGKDICTGSFNINYVRDEFAAAAQMLAEVSEDAEANMLAAGKDAGDRHHQKENGTITDTLPMLSLLMDVECAVGRTPAADAARRALEHRAEEARQVVKKRFQNIYGNTTNTSHKRSSSGNVGNSKGTKRRKFFDTQDDHQFNYPPPCGYPPIHNQQFPLPSSNFHSLSSSTAFAPRNTSNPSFSLPYLHTAQLHQQGPPQRQSQEKHIPKGSKGRGGQARGSKGSRAVEAQWKDTRGQFLDYGDDGPDYKGGGFGGGQEAMQLKKKVGGRFSGRKSSSHHQQQQQQQQQKKKKKGIKRKSKGATKGNTTDLGAKKVQTKKKRAKKKTEKSG